MKHFALRLAFGISLFVFALPLQGQMLKSFNSDPKFFLREIDDYMNAGKNEYCRKAISEFQELYKKGAVSPDEFKSIHSVCDKMIARKMMANPYFLDYFTAINGLLADSLMSDKLLSPWSGVAGSILDGLQGGRFNDYATFLKFSNDFFLEKALYYTPNGPIWKCTSPDFTISYDSGKVVLVYPQTDLIGIRLSDSIFILQTSGAYYPLQNLWQGNEAMVTWDRTGLNGVRCTFPRYTINAKETGYRAAPATLIHPTLFDGPVTGYLEDKLVVKSPQMEYQYPRFVSSDKMVLKDIGERIEYAGSFRLSGAEIQGSGSGDLPAEIRILNESGEVVACARSSYFLIQKGIGVQSRHAKVSIYMGKDSLYNSDIAFRYNVPKRILSLYPDYDTDAATPFVNSYQNVEIFVKALEWKIDQSFISIGVREMGGSGSSEVNFESSDLFNILRFEYYRGIADYNALTKIGLFWRDLMAFKELENKKTLVDGVMVHTNAIDKKKYNFLKEKLPQMVQSLDSLKELLPNLDPVNRQLPTTYISWLFLSNKDVSGVGRLLGDMQTEGYVFYDPDRQVVTLRDKLFLYCDAAANNTDFDFINIKSVLQPPAMLADIGKKKPDTKKKKWADWEERKKREMEEALNADKKPALDTTVANAQFDLKTGAMKIYGVEEVMLSDTQFVYIEPATGEIELFEDRDMRFGGILGAGKTVFVREKNDFLFDYEMFEVKADSVDFLELWVRVCRADGCEMGDYRPWYGSCYIPQECDLSQSLNTRLEKLQGTLFVDAPHNKSGRDNIAIFPSFECVNTPFAYYDSIPVQQGSRKNNGEVQQIHGGSNKRAIQKGAYKRDKFYYQLEPFILDTLDAFAPEYLRFKGKLVSAGIMPVVNEPLRIMWHDLSLGFDAMTPGEGYPIYGGKGHYTGKYELSNSGLTGLGRVEYLVSKFNSKDIVFFPDSMTASSYGFNIQESDLNGVEFPQVSADSVTLKWLPYQDEMRIRSGTVNPFKVFNTGNYSLKGEMILTPKGIIGNGEFYWNDAKVLSKKMLFGKSRMDADTSDVFIYALNNQLGQDGLAAIKTQNVKAHFDFGKQLAEFSSNNPDPNNQNTEFPLNKFSTSLSEFNWDMDAQKINMFSTIGQKGKFLSGPLDSLAFLGEKADYDLKNNILQVEGVEFVRVADAFVYLDDKRIKIRKDGDMDSLINTRIVADTATRYHVINRANVKIRTGLGYEGNGYYEYNVGDKPQEIRFEKVGSQKRKKLYITEGSGTITENAGFILDPKIGFHGKAELSADQQNILFNGFARLNTTTVPITPWFSINNRLDRKKVVLEYDVPVTPDRRKIFSGLWLHPLNRLTGEYELYNTVMHVLKEGGDREIFTAKGTLRYDAQRDEFVFASDTSKPETPQNQKMTVSDKTGKILAEGRFTFWEGKPDFVVSTVGYAEATAGTPNAKFTLSLGLGYYLPDGVAAKLAEQLANAGSPLENFNARNLEKYLPELAVPTGAAKIAKGKDKRTDDEKAAELKAKNARLEQVNKVIGEVKDGFVPDFSFLGFSFFFPELKMEWSDKHQTFLTKDAQIGLSAVGKKSVNRKLKGLVEIVPKSENNDEVYVYFESDETGDKYLFYFTKNYLRVHSSDENFNASLYKLKGKDLEQKVGDDFFYIDLMRTEDALAFFGRHNL